MREHIALITALLLALLVTRAWVQGTAEHHAADHRDRDDRDVSAAGAVPTFQRGLAATRDGAAAVSPDRPAAARQHPCANDAVGVVVGLWIVAGNKKHRPGFYLKRLATVARGVASQGWSLTLVTNSDAAQSAAEDAYKRATKRSAQLDPGVPNTRTQPGVLPTASRPPGAGLRVRRVALDELPYAGEALAVNDSCSTKYGKQLPRGALRALDRIWLSKLWALATSANAGTAQADRQLGNAPPQAGTCAPKSWAWFDAGLNAEEVRRAVRSIRAAPMSFNATEVRIQFYPAGMRKAATAYFRGRCSIEHTLNAKVVWASPAALGGLLTAFDACLALLVKRSQSTASPAQPACECWDEETVLAHLQARVPPCDAVGVPLPSFAHIDVYDPNKRIK